jgi:hypothetical protein
MAQDHEHKLLAIRRGGHVRFGDLRRLEFKRPRCRHAGKRHPHQYTKERAREEVLHGSIPELGNLSSCSRKTEIIIEPKQPMDTFEPV